MQTWTDLGLQQNEEKNCLPCWGSALSHKFLKELVCVAFVFGYMALKHWTQKRKLKKNEPRPRSTAPTTHAATTTQTRAATTSRRRLCADPPDAPGFRTRAPPLPRLSLLLRLLQTLPESLGRLWAEGYAFQNGARSPGSFWSPSSEPTTL